MNKKTHLSFALIIAVLAVIVPVVLALYLSFQQSLKEKTSEILRYAQDIQFRSDNTAQQVVDGINKLESITGDPCEDKNLDIMRDIDISSSYIQAVGYVSHDRVICSSLGKSIKNWNLGPVDGYTARGGRFTCACQSAFCA